MISHGQICRLVLRRTCTECWLLTRYPFHAHDCDQAVRHVIHPSMQVWVYEEADDSGEPNLYVHHDIMLPAFPLSLAWIDCSPSDPSSVANLAAVRPFLLSLQASSL